MKVEVFDPKALPSVFLQAEPMVFVVQQATLFGGCWLTPLPELQCRIGTSEVYRPTPSFEILCS